MADENIVIQFTADTQKAIEDTKKFIAAVEDAKTKLKEMQAQSGLGFKNLGVGLKNNLEPVSEGFKQIASTGKVVNDAVTSLNKTTKETAPAMKGAEVASGGFAGALGTIASGALRLLGIFSAYAALRSIIGWFTSAAQAGFEFAKAIFQLSVGVRALQRAGIEITIKEVYDNLTKLKDQFKIFATVDLIKGSASLVNLVRDLQLTSDQIFTLQRAIATLAVVNGRAMDEVQRTVALAMSSGYTEGLQRLGVSINRVNIALEAQRLGWGRVYMALTEQQRATATYNLIIQKTAKYQDDLLTYQNTAPGQVDRLTAAWRDFTNQIGKSALPILGAVATILSRVVEGLISFAQHLEQSKIGEAFRVMGAGAAAFGAQMDYVYKILKNTSFTLADLMEAYEEFYKAMFQGESVKDALDKFKKSIYENIENFDIETFNKVGRDAAEAFYKGLTDVDVESNLEAKLEEMLSRDLTDLEQIEEDYHQGNLDAEADYQDAKTDLFREGDEKRADLLTDHLRKLAEIELDYQRDIADAWTDYYRDVSQINTDYANDVADAKHKANDDEYNAEQKFLEKMRQLREEFLFDLEDALHERDARKVLDLIRRYDLDKTQAQREYDLEKKEREKAFKDEMQELERQRDQRMQELQDELAFRLQEIALAREREIADENLRYVQELIDLGIYLARRNAEIEAAKVAELAQLDADIAARYLKIATGWANEIELTEAAVAALKALIATIFVDNPEMVAALINDFNTAMQLRLHAHSLQGNFAEGGTLIATKPTLALFGERGAEAAFFKPLNRIGANEGRVFGGALPQGGSGGKSVVEISLAEGLRGEIIDDTLGEMADVLISLRSLP